MKNKTVIGVALFIAVLLVFVLIALYQKRQLKNNFPIATGRIYELGNSYKSGSRIFFKFTFEVNNRSFKGNTSIHCDRKNKSLFSTMLVNGQMPVVYEKDNPDNCEMLFLKSSFKKYKTEIPNDIITTVDSIENICSESD